ncbi:glutamate racemase [Ramlibacter sp. AW1]|uniref:Glutamate racemase n=1 Tax=Ramlibacter aurantiacus TaxID=2801330 RepID=A0A936ZI37_9BURK|nr:glutamate racemase [Ramlibacter aurantiacus]
MSPSPIGVFDSGIGGLSILRALRAALPGEDFVYYADTGHAPYGERGDKFVAERSLAVTRELMARHGIKLLVVACNTATAAAIARLRQTWPELPIVGVEPALKPAAKATRSGHVGVLATRGTLASAKFAQLHDSIGGQVRFHLQPCDGLAAAIEADDAALVETLCQRYLTQLGLGPGGRRDIDTLVLGCTHYAFATEVIARIVGLDVRILETGEPVARQTARLLAERGIVNQPGRSGHCLLLGSGVPQALQAAATRWLPGFVNQAR